MDNHVLVDPENIRVGDVRKGVKLGGNDRKKLSDISNLQEQPKPTNPDLKKKSITLGPKEYVEKLQKDNAELMKHLAERDKFIELSLTELRKLRLNLQKVQIQNSQFAQANSQMLAELNNGKDRLKLLHHELGCANGLLKARNLEAEEIRKRNAACKKQKICISQCEELGNSSQAQNEDKLADGNQRKQSRKQSLGRLQSKVVQANEEVNKKRRCSRRLKVKESDATEDSFEVEIAKFPASSLHEASGQPSVNLFTEKEDDHDKNVDLKPEDLKTDTRPCLRRQSARLKVNESEATEDLLHNAEVFVSLPRDDPVDTKGQPSIPLAAKKDDEESVDPGNKVNSEHLPGKTNKKRASRRQSSRFKSSEEAVSEDLFDNCDAEFQDSFKESFKEEERGITGSEALNHRRSSVGRPSRRAAEKIQCYKERSIHTKLRRE